MSPCLLKELVACGPVSSLSDSLKRSMETALSSFIAANPSAQSPVDDASSSFFLVQVNLFIDYPMSMKYSFDCKWTKHSQARSMGG